MFLYSNKCYSSFTYRMVLKLKMYTCLVISDRSRYLTVSTWWIEYTRSVSMPMSSSHAAHTMTRRPREGPREHKSTHEEKHRCFCGVHSWPLLRVPRLIDVVVTVLPRPLSTGTVMGHLPRFSGTTLACLLLLFTVTVSAGKQIDRNFL